VAFVRRNSSRALVFILGTTSSNYACLVYQYSDSLESPLPILHLRFYVKIDLKCHNHRYHILCALLVVLFYQYDDPTHEIMEFIRFMTPGSNGCMGPEKLYSIIYRVI
jgi:hypothetical protein